MDLRLHHKQGVCYQSKATEILYGGAAGGGKSHLLRIIALTYAFAIPNIQIYLFRRVSEDLEKNHLYGESGLLVLLADWMKEGKVKYNSQKKMFVFDNGARIFLCHCQHEKDVFKYQGAEIHILLIDELTHFTDYIYRFLRNRVRLGGLSVPLDFKGKLPLIVNGSNPGNIGHAWVKETFVNYAPPYDIVKTEKSEGGMMRQYIPARLDDNPTLQANDPDYVDRLEGLGSPDLVRAMKDGDWDIVAGAAFEKLSREVHMIRPFPIPDYWTKFSSLDWGTAKPYANLWFAVNDEPIEIKARDDWPSNLIPSGSLIIYRELYGYGGKADTGTREESYEVARKIHKAEDEAIDYRIGDSAMWAQHDGSSAAENFMRELHRLDDGCADMEKSKKDRIANYLELRNRIANSYTDDMPGIYIFSTCTHWWRTVPELQLDERDPEKGPETNQEDHLYDATSYGCVSRPVKWTKKSRDEYEYRRAQRLAKEADRGSINVGRY